MKTVFVVMNAEILHPGHLNILETARELGEVTVGLATDEFAARYKRLPLMSYEQRKTILENIRGVTRVIPQETLDLEPVLRRLKPDYFVHGDDWKTGRLQSVRRQAIELLDEWGGQLVEPAYTEGISSTQLDAAVRRARIAPQDRSRRFRRLLVFQPIVRIIEIHDELTGMAADRAEVRAGGKPEAFDALFLGCRAGLSQRSKPNPGEADFTARMGLVQEILDATTKPLLVEINDDLDRLPLRVKALERAGIAALVLVESPQDVENPENVRALAGKVIAAKGARTTTDFSVLVRLHSGPPDHAGERPLSNARAYLEAGADALIIPSGPGPDEERFDFFRRFAADGIHAPLLAAVPADVHVAEQPLSNGGARGIVYEGDLLRTACDALKQAAEILLPYPDAEGAVNSSAEPAESLRRSTARPI